jgi:putative SOS response-associated peptidase YedK
LHSIPITHATLPFLSRFVVSFVVMCGRAACSLAPAALLQRTGAVAWHQGCSGGAAPLPCGSPPNDEKAAAVVDCKAEHVKADSNTEATPACCTVPATGNDDTKSKIKSEPTTSSSSSNGFTYQPKLDTTTTTTMSSCDATVLPATNQEIIDEYYRPAFNLQQGSFIPVLTMDDTDGTRHLTSMQWGLIGSFSETPDSVHLRKPVNARAETVSSKRCFKRLLHRNRCAVVFNGFFEFQKLSLRNADGSKNTARQPFYFSPQQSITQESALPNASPQHHTPLLYLAALYDTWSSADQTRQLSTVTVLTVQSTTDDLSAIHARMPLVLDGEQGLEHWLNCTKYPADVALAHAVEMCKAKLAFDTPVSAGDSDAAQQQHQLLHWYRVSQSVNHPEFNSDRSVLQETDITKVLIAKPTKKRKRSGNNKTEPDSSTDNCGDDAPSKRQKRNNDTPLPTTTNTASTAEEARTPVIGLDDNHQAEDSVASDTNTNSSVEFEQAPWSPDVSDDAWSSEDDGSQSPNHSSFQ